MSALHGPRQTPATVEQWIAWCSERHMHWCEVLEQFLLRQGLQPPKKPAAELRCMRAKAAGKYFRRAHACVYYAGFLCAAGLKYDITIAHECCHAYQRYLGVKRMAWHGEMFYFLLRVVCGFRDADRFHDINPALANNVADALSASGRAKRKARIA